MIKKLSVALLLITCLSLPMAAYAAVIQSDPSRESIKQFKSTITVGNDAMLNVTEDIQYDMDGVAHHGLERLIPVSSYLQSENKYINYQFHLTAVSDDGNSSAKYSLVQENSWYRLRIGDPNVTKTGVHDYVISYTYGPIISKTDKGDLFDYNIFGTNWVLPAQTVQASVTLPANIPINDYLCFTGVNGSTAKDCTATVNGQTINVATTRELSPYEGMDLQILSPANSFTAYTVKADKPTQPSVDTRGTTAIVILVLDITAFVIGSLVFKVIRKFREFLAKKRQTVIAQYESPDNLSPAEIGLLIDKRFSSSEIVATLVDLAIRGYLRIRETRPKRWFMQAQYELDLLKKPEGLKDYELQVLTLIFDDSQLVSPTLPVTAALKRNNSAKSYTIFTSMTKELKKSMENKSYYKSKGNPMLAQAKKLVFPSILLIFAGALVCLLTKNYWPLAAASFIFSFAIASIFLAEDYTQLGYEEWAKVKGFELFLTVTEKDRMKFENAPAKTPALFNKLLPYAIALGVEKKWAKQFDALDLKDASSWYVGGGTGYYSAVALTSSLSSSFSSVISSSVVPAANSGGFGGGGAGGGGGGGGGGGW